MNIGIMYFFDCVSKWILRSTDLDMLNLFLKELKVHQQLQFHANHVFKALQMHLNM